MIDVLLVLALLGVGYAVPIPMAPSPDVLAKTEYVRLPSEEPREDMTRLRELFRTEDVKASASAVLHQAQIDAHAKIPTFWEKFKR